ncbi:MAG: hypothetical protein GF333_00710 [Candidatus Omnitrophica bacterium]|nr:hypothetical protein [Candidatus Omnitrophota bacterium]
MNGIIRRSSVHRRNIGILLLCGAAVLSACVPLRGPRWLSEEAPALRGTVRYVSLEGGFYGIVTDGGARLLPLNLPERFETDGLSIRFRGYQKRDVITQYMWGVPFFLEQIRTVPGSSPEHPRNIPGSSPDHPHNLRSTA